MSLIVSAVPANTSLAICGAVWATARRSVVTHFEHSFKEFTC